MKKNIVILSTMYYPDMGAPSACVDKFVQVLKNRYNFYIITKSYKANIVPDGKYKIRYISSWMQKVIVSAKDEIFKGRNIRLNKSKLILVNAYKLISTQFSYPTSGSWESREYYNELKKLSMEIEIDTVIAVSNTFFTQLAAMRFKKEHNDIKYISFIYDPYSMNYVYYQFKLCKSLWFKLNSKIEQKIYNISDSLFFTNEMYNYALNTFNFDKNKAERIQFTLTPFFTSKIENEENDCRPIRIIFAGALYRHIRNPLFLLQVFSQIDCIKFDIFTDSGDCDDIIQSFLSPTIRRFPVVPRDKYIAMINSEYDILLNIANVSTLQAPSKIVELLSTGRPILNFYRNKDSQYRMIEKYPLGLNVGYQEEGAVHKVTTFCKENRGKMMTFEEVAKLFPDNALENQVSLLIKAIEE